MDNVTYDSCAFVCTSQAFIVQENPAKLFQVDQSGDPFIFNLIGGPYNFEINALGFNTADGLLYGWHRNSPMAGTSQEIVTIDANDVVTGLGSTDQTLTVRFNAGDVSPDGSVMYLNLNGGGRIYTVDLSSPGLAVTSSPQIKIGATNCTDNPTTNPCGRVADWAAHPNDTPTLLYGGDDKDGELAILNPTTGVRTDVAVAGCTPMSQTCSESALAIGFGFGAAWFNPAGKLFLFRNRDGSGGVGTIYEIKDPSGTPEIISVKSGLNSRFNDGAACVAAPVGIELSKEITSGPWVDDVTMDVVIGETLPDNSRLAVADDIAKVVEIKQGEETEYDFTITYTPDSTDVVIIDTVNAEWEVTSVGGEIFNCTAQNPADLTGTGISGTVTVTSNGRKCGKGSTTIELTPDVTGGEVSLNVVVETREKKRSKFFPTSCGLLFLNEGGATAFESPLPPPGMDPVIVAGPTEPLGLIALGDENTRGDTLPDEHPRDGSGDFDSDGLTDATEVFDLGTDPCLDDTDDDGVNDDLDTCPLEGLPNTGAGETLGADGCIEPAL